MESSKYKNSSKEIFMNESARAVANTSLGAAADWFSPGNWSGGAACPDGNVYIRAVMDVAGMTGCR
jgi:hypothetical protein